MLLLRLQPSPQTLRSQLNPRNFRTETPRVANSPRLELTHTDDQVILRLELPGLEGKDLEVQATRQAVAIRGERSADKDLEGQNILYSERRYGKFEREIALPVEVRNDEAIAQFSNGILTLTLPKVQPDSKRVVKLNLETGENALTAESEEGDLWDSEETQAA